MGDADCRRLGDARTADRGIFELDRADPFAARLDDVLRAVGDLQGAVRVEGGDVAGVKPLLVVGGVLRLPEIALHHPGAAGQQPARADPVARQIVAVVVDGLQFDAEDGATLLAGIVHLLLVAHLRPAGGRRPDGADRRHFGHPPGMADADAAVAEPLDHRPRRRRAANGHDLEVAQIVAGALDMLDHAQPDRRHAGAVADLLVMEQLAHLLRPVVGAQHQLAADHRRRPRHAPGIGVEHRHDRQDHGLRRQIEAVRRHFRIRVQHRRAMLVEHALGVAGGAAGVAKAAGIALVALVPAVIAVLGGDPGVELVLEADEMLDRRPLRLQPLDDRLEGLVVDEDAVLGVVADIGKLLVEQARVERMQHPAHADRAIP